MIKKYYFDPTDPAGSLKNILRHGAKINSSGTTGVPKTIFRTPENLKKIISVALESQKITKNSKIFTVTRMTHAGGLLAQTLPAFSLGCGFKVQKFDPYSFFADFKNYTHTFLTPTHMQMLMNTKNFKSCDLTGKRILGGSDPVSWELIEAFVSKGATVQPNWGMSEVGPITINAVFSNLEEVHEYKNASPEGLTILGDQIYLDDYKIVDGELHIKGEQCIIYDSWFATGDLVEANKHGVLYYRGRIS